MIKIEEIKETKEKSYTEKNYLISAIIMIVVGALIFSNPANVIKFISYILALASFIYGIIRISNYLKLKDNSNEAKYMLLASGIIFFIIAILLVVFSSAIEILIRITMGIWILFSGINQLVLTIPTIKSKQSFCIPLIFSILLIIGGLYMIIVANILFSIIGLILLIYGILKISMYIYYSQKYSSKKETKAKTVKSKDIKSTTKKNKRSKK